MSNDPWDGLPNGNFVKWETPGQSVVGKVLGKGVGKDLQGGDVPQMTIQLDDGSEVTVGASQAQLRAKLMEAKPNIGDRVKITFTHTEPRDKGKTLKHFEVLVKKGEAPTPEAAKAAAEDF